MASHSNDHSYPPAHATPEQFDTYITQVLQAKMNAMSEAFTQEWDNREKSLHTENEDLRAQLRTATDQITKMHPSIVDTPMTGHTLSNSTATTPASASTTVHTTIPESAPSRNLRSRTKATELNIGSKGIPLNLESNEPFQSVPKSKKKAVKTATQVYRLTSAEIPKDATGVKKALEAHIRVLWGLSNANAIPTDPPAQLLKIFETRFSMLTESDLYQQINIGPSLVSPSLVQIAINIPSNSRSKLAASIKRIEEHILDYMQTCLSKFGLWCWCPDLRQSPYSLYNAACRIVALDTFKQALVSHSYAHFNPNISYTKNLSFLVRLYDHIVHHYIYSRYKQDIKRPGSVRKADGASPQYHNRSRLATARFEFLQENRYLQRYLDLIDPKTTSDDEADPENHTENGRLVYWIRKRPERSEAANLFIRQLDKIRERSAQFDGSRRWRERLRVVPLENQKDTLFPTLPLSIPVDYFDPTSFNQLPPRLRYRVAIKKVAFLPDTSTTLGTNLDQKLDDKAFTAKYGDDVFSRYDMVGPEEFGSDDSDGGEDLQGFEEDTNMDDGEITNQRATLVAHLSSDVIA